MDYYSDIQINEKQAKMFAESIFADISEYVKDHKEEYNVFLTIDLQYKCNTKKE